MAKKIYIFCLSKPYFQNGNVDIITIKKTILNFALDEGEDIEECMGAINDVYKMFKEGK